MDNADCRTRTYVSYHRSSSGSTNKVYDKKSPARIFEHRRVPAGDCKDGTTIPASKVKFPSSFPEIEQWLDEIIVESTEKTINEAADPSGCIKLLFLDEKKCIEAFKEDFDLTKLHARLKINDWSTAHYMSTYCRFPLPLDVDVDVDNDVGKTKKNHIWDWRYTISHPFDWDMLWAYFPTTRTTVAVVRTWFKDYETNFLDLEAMVTNFPGPNYANPTLIGLFALQILTRETMGNVREKGNRLFEAQRRTGFHTYDRLRSTDIGADDGYAHDLTAITTDVLGAASNMTGWENASRQLVGFAHFLIAENGRFSFAATVAPTSRASERLSSYIEQQSQKLIGDLDGAYCDAKAWLATATFLMQGVLNLVSQRDATVNIELARDSKKIAEDARRDSTSMTAIAILTMFFLPATFTSAFFALPFFESAMAENGPANFWIYWAVTLPLMVAVMGSWLLWTRYMNRHKAAQAGLAEKA